MFRLYDTRTGRAEEITPGPGRLLRIYAFGPAGPPAAQAGGLRPALLADLIRRNAERRHDVQVVTCLVDAAGDEFSGDATALNLMPAEQTVRASERTGPAAELGARAELIVDGRARHFVPTGPVTFGGREMTGASAPAAGVTGLSGRGLDPLALRLAFLSVRHAEPADLTWEALADADLAVRRWRELVAEWAESPSRAVPAEVAAQVAAAFDDDLDTPAALRALHQLERDPGVPPGAKFESFVHADQLLGLDLPRDVGRVPLRHGSPRA